MASEPTVACILLTKDRPELAARAVRCFRSQTYDPVNRVLLILDTGDHGWYDCRSDSENEFYCQQAPDGRTIGHLRNAAVSMCPGQIVVHWDSDDYSHPNRIAEQVAFLQSSGAAVVGYSQMLFWNRTDVHERNWVPGAAWLYTGPAHQPLGTSLCYWSKTWEQHRFDDRKHCGEDTDFLARVGHRRVKSVTSLYANREHVGVAYEPHRTLVDRLNKANAIGSPEPRMIATVHGANTQQKTYDGFFEGGTLEMERVPEWDERVRMTLEGT